MGLKSRRNLPLFCAVLAFRHSARSPNRQCVAQGAIRQRPRSARRMDAGASNRSAAWCSKELRGPRPIHRARGGPAPREAGCVCRSQIQRLRSPVSAPKVRNAIAQSAAERHSLLKAVRRMNAAAFSNQLRQERSPGYPHRGAAAIGAGMRAC